MTAPPGPREPNERRRQRISLQRRHHAALATTGRWRPFSLPPIVHSTVWLEWVLVTPLRTNLHTFVQAITLASTTLLPGGVGLATWTGMGAGVVFAILMVVTYVRDYLKGYLVGHLAGHTIAHSTAIAWSCLAFFVWHRIRMARQARSAQTVPVKRRDSDIAS